MPCSLPSGEGSGRSWRAPAGAPLKPFRSPSNHPQREGRRPALPHKHKWSMLSRGEARLRLAWDFPSGPPTPSTSWHGSRRLQGLPGAASAGLSPGPSVQRTPWCSGEDRIPTGDSRPLWRCSPNLVCPRTHPRQVGLVSLLIPAAASSVGGSLGFGDGLPIDEMRSSGVPIPMPRSFSTAGPVLRPLLCWISAHEPGYVMLWVNNCNARIIWITTTPLPHTTALGVSGHALLAAVDPVDGGLLWEEGCQSTTIRSCPSRSAWEIRPSRCGYLRGWRALKLGAHAGRRNLGQAAARHAPGQVGTSRLGYEYALSPAS